jgi:VIT1/CCC1 family predicted Fe2+/Mn2+ transporter
VQPAHRERHRYGRVGWLRAGVLGANDGIVSVAALMLGVAATTAARDEIAVAGLAGLVAGALSMAAGEYVSVSSQRDAERADIARERRELRQSPGFEQAELSQIYVERGLDPDLAKEVARQLMAADPLGSHLRDELGMSHETRARPVQATLVSALGFTLGGIVPLLALLVAPSDARIPVIAGVALLLLACTGAVAGKLGGAPLGRAAARVLMGGAVAMAITLLVGELIGTAL